MTYWKIVVICLLSALTMVRVYFRWRSDTLLSPSDPSREGPMVLVLRHLLSLVLYVVVLLFIFHPRLIAWSIIPMHSSVRGISLVFGLLSLGLLIWAHRSLGASFDRTLRVQENHRLVTDGPYRYIRHPIYTAFLLFFLSLFGVSGCWAIGACAVLLFGLLMTVRLKREEAQLLERFGETYREYLRHTGRFFPRFTERPPSAKG